MQYQLNYNIWLAQRNLDSGNIRASQFRLDKSMQVIKEYFDKVGPRERCFLLQKFYQIVLMTKACMESEICLKCLMDNLNSSLKILSSIITNENEYLEVRQKAMTFYDLIENVIIDFQKENDFALNLNYTSFENDLLKLDISAL